MALIIVGKHVKNIDFCTGKHKNLCGPISDRFGRQQWQHKLPSEGGMAESTLFYRVRIGHCLALAR